MQENADISTLLDDIHGDNNHSNATQAQLNKVSDSKLTPSAKVIHRMDELKTPFFKFAMNQSLANSDYFRSLSLEQQQKTNFENIAEQSNRDRDTIEASDNMPFDEYLANQNSF